jgi:nucleotide-binding universal stress UspA family protein
MKNEEAKQPILVPVDFSEHAGKAIALGAEMALCMGSTLVVLHVVHDPGESPGYYAFKGRKKLLTRMEDTAGDMLNEFMVDLRKKFPKNKAVQDAKSVLVVGLPVTRILEVADKENARMIVMGSQGRTGLSHLMIGSKAEQVVHLSKRPVTIVKDTE